MQENTAFTYTRITGRNCTTIWPFCCIWFMFSICLMSIQHNDTHYNLHTHVRRSDGYMGLIRARWSSSREGSGSGHSMHQHMKSWEVTDQPGSAAQHLNTHKLPFSQSTKDVAFTMSVSCIHNEKKQLNLYIYIFSDTQTGHRLKKKQKTKRWEG